jgi:hypothetical protein
MPSLPLLHIAVALLKRFRNYCGLMKVAMCGFPWEKTTKRAFASVYTNCETALMIGRGAGEFFPYPLGKGVHLLFAAKKVLDQLRARL